MMKESVQWQRSVRSDEVVCALMKYHWSSSLLIDDSTNDEVVYSLGRSNVDIDSSSSSSSLLSTLKIATRQKVGGSTVTVQT